MRKVKQVTEVNPSNQWIKIESMRGKVYQDTYLD